MKKVASETKAIEPTALYLLCFAHTAKADLLDWKKYCYMPCITATKIFVLIPQNFCYLYKMFVK